MAHQVRWTMGEAMTKQKPCIYCGERTFLRTRGATPVAMCYACLARSNPTPKCEECRTAERAEGLRVCEPCAEKYRTAIRAGRG